MFSLHEKVVYPGYGVAQISRLVQRIISGTTTNFFELTFAHKDMTILIPENRLESVGVRRLISKKQLQVVFADLMDIADCKSSDLSVGNWNKRNKEYQCKLRTGDIFQVSSIYKDLKIIGFEKELSFGERNLLVQIEEILVEEVGAVLGVDYDHALIMLEKPFKQYEQSHNFTHAAQQNNSHAHVHL